MRVDPVESGKVSPNAPDVVTGEPPATWFSCNGHGHLEKSLPLAGSRCCVALSLTAETDLHFPVRFLRAGVSQPIRAGPLPDVFVRDAPLVDISRARCKGIARLAFVGSIGLFAAIVDVVLV